jgi:serine/threonine protein kinase
LTGEGVLLGTPDYLAPEQARDPRSIDIRADIYSLGCTLYHLLSGQTPFPDKNILTQMMRHASEKPKALQEFNPAIPEGLAQIVNWMMAKKPEERYPTPARAAQALDAYLMVVSEPATLLEDTPQMQNFLSWLEKSEPPAEPISAAKPGSNPGASSATPISIPKMPAASKPGSAAPAMGKLAAPARKRKRRTGVKLGETPVAAPATVPPPEAPPREAPPREAPPAQPITADQIDVELVALPEQTPPKPTRSGLRDVLMIGIGVLLTLMLSGCCWGVSLVIAMLTPVSE